MMGYARQEITDQDMKAVAEAMRGDILTGGLLVERFEREFAAYHGYQHGVAVSSGTAALDTAINVVFPKRSGMHIFVPTMTFVATVNAIEMNGHLPVLKDVSDETLLLSKEKLEEEGDPPFSSIECADGILAVDYGGRLVSNDVIIRADELGIPLIIDACHSTGIPRKGMRPLVSVHSFHPVKAMTTFEGGMLLTDDLKIAEDARRFRSHGMSTAFRDRTSYDCDMVQMGRNYRLSDVACALGLSQLKRLGKTIERKRQLVMSYYHLLKSSVGKGLIFFWQCTNPNTWPMLDTLPHAWHLLLVGFGKGPQYRDYVYRSLLERGIRCGVHYRPVHLHTYYRDHRACRLPNAEAAWEDMLTLPLWHGMTDHEVQHVCTALKEVIDAESADLHDCGE